MNRAGGGRVTPGEPTAWDRGVCCTPDLTHPRHCSARQPAQHHPSPPAPPSPPLPRYPAANPLPAPFPANPSSLPPSLTPRSYFPLRLRLARALNRLAAQSGVFIPVGPLAVEALGWADLRRPPGGGGGGGKGGKGASALGADGCPDLSLQLKLGKALLRSSAVQEEVVTQVGWCGGGMVRGWNGVGLGRVHPPTPTAPHAPSGREREPPLASLPPHCLSTSPTPHHVVATLTSPCCLFRTTSLYHLCTLSPTKFM